MPGAGPVVAGAEPTTALFAPEGTCWVEQVTAPTVASDPVHYRGKVFSGWIGQRGVWTASGAR